MSYLLCLLLGHDWFDTAISDVVQEEPGWGRYELNRYSEHICLRCQMNKPTFISTLDSWDMSHAAFYSGEEGYDDEGTPDWMNTHPTATALPGRWGLAQ